MGFPANGSESIYQPLGSARGCVAVTKSLTVNVFGKNYNITNGGDARACRALLVGTAGAQSIVLASGEVCVDVPLQAGYNPLQVIQVLTSGTNGATNIWALF